MPAHRVYRVGSPFNGSEMAELDYEQLADVLYLAHQNHEPQKLIREDHTDWAFQAVDFQPLIADPTGVSGSATVPNTDAPNSGNAYFPQPATYVVTAYNEITGQESRASSSVTLTNDLSLKRNYNTINWNAVAGATEYRVYKADNSQLYGLIGRTDQLTFRDDNIGADLSQGPPIADNPFDSAGNYPGAVTFHEQRAFWARTINRPNGVFGSRSADPENMDFTRPTREDDAFVIGLAAKKVNAVNRLVSNKQGLLAFTTNHIFSIQGSNEDYITAAPPPRVRPEVSRGASLLKPITVDEVTFYETAKTGEIRALGYTFEIDGLRTNDISLFSRHLFENHEIVSWVYAEKPASAIIAVRRDGKALCMTWDQAQQVWGWTVWETSGWFRGVTSVTEQGEDRIYFLVERVRTGNTTLFVERMASELWTDQDLACYLDCARTFVNEEPVSTVDRLEHIEGRTVYAFVDGNVITASGGDPLVVTDGQLELPVAGTTITVGLPFTAEIETLPLAVQTGQGWSVFRPQQANKIVLNVVNSRNIMAGPAADLLYEAKTRDGSNVYADPLSLYTGPLDMDMPGTSENETVVVVRSDVPTPMHIAAVLVEPSIEGQQ